MNTAMADGARDRLVAQIGEALFGQPGLNLMELAEKVKGMQPSPATTVLGHRVVADPAVQPGTFEIRQPSPGGQEQARGQFEAWYVENAFDYEKNPIGSRECSLMWKAWQAALAARQPVGQITDSDIDTRLNALYREMVDSGQHNGGMSGVAWDRAVYRMAARQPVGPKFYTEDGPCWWHDGKAFIVTVDGDTLQLSVMSGVHCEFIGDSRPFRVPAQALKLERFREAVTQWKLSAERVIRCKGHAMAEEKVMVRDEATRLLALIDNQDSTNG